MLIDVIFYSHVIWSEKSDFWIKTEWESPKIGNHELMSRFMLRHSHSDTKLLSGYRSPCHGIVTQKKTALGMPWPMSRPMLLNTKNTLGMPWPMSRHSYEFFHLGLFMSLTMLSLGNNINSHLNST